MNKKWRHKKWTPKGRVLRSRYIMEQHLGRKLRSDEVVHHKNDNCRDDRLENLEVMDKMEHFRLHGKRRRTRPDKAWCLVCGLEYIVRKKGRRPSLYRGKETGKIFGYCTIDCYRRRGR